MINYIQLFIAFLISGMATFLLTFPVKKFALRFGILDIPNHRKIHIESTARFGGMAIFLGVIIGIIYLHPTHENLPEIITGAIVIVFTGALDDKFSIRPVVKLTGQLIAASFLISSGLIIERITLPLIGVIDLGFFSVLITILWIIGITNAINLIDGLDGLATGVSTIALMSLFVIALLDMQIVAASLCAVIIGANLGFLYHNFHPASIYMGDTGSNFLGYMIAVISISGLFKNVALFSFIIPVIVLAVPIFDTFFAIVRRLHKKENIMMPDNQHIHYQLIKAGFSHRSTVLIIYGFSALFGVLAVLFSYATLTVSLLITLLVLILIHLLAELAGLVLDGKRPVIDLLRKIVPKKKRDQT